MAIDPVAPAITPETDEQWKTRARFASELVDALRDKLAAAEIQVTGGEDDGVTVVTHKGWRDALREVDYAPLPPIDNHYAEVLTGASITVWATCPRCGIAGPIMLLVDPELRVDTSGAELRLKAKAKPRTHICGQLTIPAAGAAEGQSSFELEDIVGDASSVDLGEGAGDADQDDDGADDAGDEDQDADDDLLPGEIRCEGSVHVPNCSCFDGPEFGDA
jgi:hypothetical protein